METASNMRTLQISENQAGQLSLGDLMVYDLDLGENSSFSIGFHQVSIDAGIDICHHIKPFAYTNANGSTQGVSSLGLTFLSPFDYESIDAMSTVDQATGTASKLVEFSVND